MSELRGFYPFSTRVSLVLNGQGLPQCNAFPLPVSGLRWNLFHTVSSSVQSGPGRLIDHYLLTEKFDKVMTLSLLSNWGSKWWFDIVWSDVTEWQSMAFSKKICRGILKKTEERIASCEIPQQQQWDRLQALKWFKVMVKNRSAISENRLDTSHSIGIWKPWKTVSDDWLLSVCQE